MDLGPLQHLKWSLLWRLEAITIVTIVKSSIFYVAVVVDLPLKNRWMKIDNIVFLQCLDFTDRILHRHALAGNHLSFQSCCID